MTLGDYYNYIEPICLDIVGRILTYPHQPVNEAAYLIQAVQRFWLSRDKYNTSIFHVDQEPIQSVIDYLSLLRCHYQSYLSGKMTGSDIIKLGGHQLWEDYNKVNPLKLVYAQGVADNLPVIDKGSYLELGAGVGATTSLASHVLQQGHYTFSDLKQSFLEYAPDYADARLVNILEFPDMPHYDVIFATNVLHCAHDIPETLSWLCNRCDTLIVGEGSPYSLSTPWPLDILFALFPGWGDVPTSTQRPYAGFLHPTQWEYFAGEAGLSMNVLQLISDERSTRHTFGGVYSFQNK